MKKNLSSFDLVIILITAVLFVVALFVKGLTKELLLEAGILLVSIKLIMMNYKTSMANKRMQKDLDEIKALLGEMKNPKK